MEKTGDALMQVGEQARQLAAGRGDMPGQVREMLTDIRLSMGLTEEEAGAVYEGVGGARPAASWAGTWRLAERRCEAARNRR